MAALKQRLTRLEEAINDLTATSCPSCHSFGHPRRFIRPLLDERQFHFGEAELVPDDRLDADGCCMVCGARSVLAPTVDWELPRMLQAQCKRLC